jgi:hypothetical protein
MAANLRQGGLGRASRSMAARFANGPMLRVWLRRRGGPEQRSWTQALKRWRVRHDREPWHNSTQRKYRKASRPRGLFSLPRGVFLKFLYGAYSDCQETFCFKKYFKKYIIYFFFQSLEGIFSPSRDRFQSLKGAPLFSLLRGHFQLHNGGLFQSLYGAVSVPQEDYFSPSRGRVSVYQETFSVPQGRPASLSGICNPSCGPFQSLQGTILVPQGNSLILGKGSISILI